MKIFNYRYTLKQKLNFNIPTKKFSSIYNPNSLVFKHKRELDKIQKQMTRMKTPLIVENVKLNDEADFEPGLDYLGNFSDLILKVCPKQINFGIPVLEASPEDGFIQLQMPFDKDIKLRNSYRLLNYERIRFGKLLEILDYLTAFTAFRFNNILPKSKLATMVTAGVDIIELFKNVNLSERLIINSYPTWTGESSMEVRIDMYNGPSGKTNNENNEQDEDFENEESFLGSATFSYVLRNANDYTLKKKVAALKFDNLINQEEKAKARLRQEIGNENKKIRIKKSQLSLFKSPPTQEESAILHEQFVSYKACKDIINAQTNKGVDTSLVSIKSSKYSITDVRTILDTKIEKSVLMHSQNININGHVFGGYIMREALELGYVCAYMHSNKENPDVISVDSVSFHKPVIIGSIAQFKSHVSLVHEELLHVCVEVFNIVNSQVTPVLTTTINITYKTKNKTPRVFPTTYECGVKYLEAKRIIEKLFNIF